LRVEWYRSATVGIFSKTGGSVLCDPWITNGAFLGSWFHFPPLEGFEFEKLSVQTDWSALYISHLHADHFDRKLVSAIARANPKTKCVIPKFPNGWLRRAVENCGFTGPRLIELGSGETYEIDGIEITIFRADYCDPEKCGVNVPCLESDSRLSSIDSLALFEADNHRILNANDALAVASVPRALKAIGSVDLLLGHYGGAGPYPQCFNGLSKEEKIVSATSMARSFLRRLADATAGTKAKYVMPYAGQYLLGGRLASLNNYRSVVTLTEAVEYLASKTQAKPIAMEPFSYFDLDEGIVRAEWQEPDESEINSYLSKISKTIFPYERGEPDWANAISDFESALHSVGNEYLRQLPISGTRTNHRISITTSQVSGFIQFTSDDYYVAATESDLDSLKDDETRITLHPNLLKGMITRKPGYTGFTPLHFNQAEIGSHLNWERKGDYDSVIRLLNFMQIPSLHSTGSDLVQAQK